MLIIDGDYPMALAVRANRDLTLPIDEARNAPPVARGSLGWPDKEIMATLPEMRRGQVAAALVKVAVDMERPGAVIVGGPRSDQLAYALGQGQMAYYHILQTMGEARLLRNKARTAVAHG